MRLPTIVAAAAALLRCALVAPAQTPGAASCDPNIVYNENPSPDGADAVRRIHPLLSRARYADAVRNEQWTAALDALRDDAMQSFVAAGVPSAEQQTFLLQVDSTLAALAALPAANDPGRAAYVAGVVRASRFTPAHLVSTWQLFRGSERIDVGALGAGQARALCWSALSVDQVLLRLRLGLEPNALARLARLNTSWANYRSYGYTQQPLELIVFRRRAAAHDTLPRTNQWLLGHLSLGAEVRWRDSTTTVATSVVEVLGVLHYRGDFTQYFGASAIVGVPSGRRPGYGAMVHFARGLRGGVLFRREARSWRWSPIVSTDLYGLLERSKRSVEAGLALARGRVILGTPAER